MYKPILSVFLLSAAAVTVIIFAYYTTVLIGRKMNRLLEGRYTQVLERTMIGIGMNVTILKINRKIYIVAIQGKTIRLLDVIEEDDWKFPDDKNKIQFDTQNTNDCFMMNKLFSRIKKAVSNSRYNRNGSDDDEQYKV